MHTAWDDAQAGSIHVCAIEEALSPEPEADRETFKRQGGKFAPEKKKKLPMSALEKEKGK